MSQSKPLPFRIVVENAVRSLTAVLSLGAAIFLAGWYPGGTLTIPSERVIPVAGLLVLGVLVGTGPLIKLVRQRDRHRVSELFE